MLFLTLKLQLAGLKQRSCFCSVQPAWVQLKVDNNATKEAICTIMPFRLIYFLTTLRMSYGCRGEVERQDELIGTAL